jgi:histidine ammonia-lyase
MPVVLERRADITLDAFRRVAWGGESVQLGAAALARVADARRSFMALLDDPSVVIYGVTSGYGDRASVRLDPAERRAQGRMGAGNIRISFDDPLPNRVVRGMVLARLASIVEGNAAVRPEIAEAVAGMLDRDPLPAVPARGNGGAGEIIALGHLFGGLATLELEEKESVALVNGSPGSAALVADAALAARGRLRLAEEVLALSAEALRAPLEAYAPELEELWGDPHETAALRRLRALLTGGAAERRAFQAPVSYRILPRVLGQAHRALAEAERAATVSLSEVSDNPIFVPPSENFPAGRILSNGSFHNARAPAALDGLAGAWADLCQLAERHTHRLRVDPQVLGRSDVKPSPVTYLQMVQVAYTEEARSYAQRTALPSGGFDQDDVVSTGFLAWSKEERAAGCLEAVLATLAATASEALQVSGRPAPPELAALLAEVREHVPVQHEELFGEGLGRLASAFGASVLAASEL